MRFSKGQLGRLARGFWHSEPAGDVDGGSNDFDPRCNGGRRLLQSARQNSRSEWIIQTFRGTGAQATIGLELRSIFQSVGLPAPTLRLDAAVGAVPDTPAYKMLPEIVRSLLPVMERLGIATAAEVEVESLGLRIRDEVAANNGIVTSPSLIGAWATHQTAAIKRNDRARHTNK